MIFQQDMRVITKVSELAITINMKNTLMSCFTKDNHNAENQMHQTTASLIELQKKLYSILTTVYSCPHMSLPD